MKRKGTASLTSLTTAPMTNRLRRESTAASAASVSSDMPELETVSDAEEEFFLEKEKNIPKKVVVDLFAAHGSYKRLNKTTVMTF